MAAPSHVPCMNCAHYEPALDRTVQQVFLGYCNKRQWPFTEMIPNDGMAWMKEHECPDFEVAEEEAD